MIRTKTALIIGAGASCELQMPGGLELLSRISQAFDFRRLGTETQSRDGLVMAQYLGKLGTRLGKSEEAIHQAADRIRVACKIARSIDSVIDQHDNDALIVACAKLAIVHFICQAEARSILRHTPRAVGDLPIQGTDSWLYYLGQLVTSGVARSRVEQCLDELTIVSFNYDRSIEHFLPHAFVMAFGMDLKEAQKLVAAKLRIHHPYGTVGRLPWQTGEGAECDWANEQPWNIHNLTAQLKTTAERLREHQAVMQIRSAVSGAKRICFLGFGFQPQNMEILIDYSLSHDPEVLATTWGLAPAIKNSVVKMLKRKSGHEDDDLLIIEDMRAFELVRDFSLLFES